MEEFKILDIKMHKCSMEDILSETHRSIIQNKRLILSEKIPYKNTNYGIQQYFNLIFFEVFDRTKNLIYTLDYDNTSFSHNYEIIFIEIIEFSYKRTK